MRFGTTADPAFDIGPWLELRLQAPGTAPAGSDVTLSANTVYHTLQRFESLAPYALGS